MMDNECEKLDLKNIIFSRAIPNYVIPIPTEGHKVYQCNNCGDEFLFESSYNNHINRKSLKIIYTCRYCSTTNIYLNRCTLLEHIRSHPNKTITINVNDLTIEMLPFNQNSTKKDSPPLMQKNKTYGVSCYECNELISSSGIIYKDRAAHYTQFTNEVHKCPICLFSLPTICALKVHLRLHFKCPPYFCPECGMHLSLKTVQYPYNHDCSGFRMMRATARYRCPKPECPLVHPSNFKTHMTECHLKKVFKCPKCFVACYNEKTIQQHLRVHSTRSKAMIFYKCDMCPGRLVLHLQIENHISAHVECTVYPCWVCSAVFEDVNLLYRHHIIKHGLKDLDITAPFLASKVTGSVEHQQHKLYRVVKRCDNCKRDFIYRCSFNKINILPNDCPYNCVPNTNSDVILTNNNITEKCIICHMCKNKISQKWEDIKEHYAKNHVEHRCIDLKVALTKLNMKEYNTIKEQSLKSMHKINKSKMSNNKRIGNRRRKRNNEQKSTTSQCIDPFVCVKCSLNCKNKEQLDIHIMTHRDPCMAYQCMECGECFVVKPSFSTHLLLKHSILDVEDYINTKQCYNEGALVKNQQSIAVEEPLRENQCSICRVQFDTLEDLEKHFRVHGMAFLIKNNLNKNNLSVMY